MVFNLNDGDTWIKNQVGEKFTFPPAFIESIKTGFETGIDQLKMPITGPLSNLGMDIDGNGKAISITGRLIDTNHSVVTDGGNNIRHNRIMKYWLEALLSGMQQPLEFYSYMDEFSVLTSGSTQFFDPVSEQNVTLSAVFQPTKVFVIGFGADDDEGDVEKIPFTLILWVGGT